MARPWAPVEGDSRVALDPACHVGKDVAHLSQWAAVTTCPARVTREGVQGALVAGGHGGRLLPTSDHEEPEKQSLVRLRST